MGIFSGPISIGKLDKQIVEEMRSLLRKDDFGLLALICGKHDLFQDKFLVWLKNRELSVFNCGVYLGLQAAHLRLEAARLESSLLKGERPCGKLTGATPESLLAECVELLHASVALTEQKDWVPFYLLAEIMHEKGNAMAGYYANAGIRRIDKLMQVLPARHQGEELERLNSYLLEQQANLQRIEKIANSIKCKCSKCGAKLMARDSRAGQMARCPRCGTAVRVPLSSGVSLEQNTIAEKYPAQLVLLYVALEADSTFFHECIRPIFQATGVKLGKASLFEVRVYFLHKLDAAMDLSGQAAKTRRALFNLCHDLIVAEFEGDFGESDLPKTIEARLDTYSKITRRTDLTMGQVILQWLKYLDNCILLCRPDGPASGPLPLVVSGIFESLQRREELVAAEERDPFSSFVGELVKQTKDIMSLPFTKISKAADTRYQDILRKNDTAE